MPGSVAGFGVEQAGLARLDGDGEVVAGPGVEDGGRREGAALGGTVVAVVALAEDLTTVLT